MYRNEQNGYIVLDLDAKNELITVIGELGDIEEGEELVLDGKYEQHSRFGRQFRATYCERKLPSTESNIRKYLESGVIKGIGPVLAKRIVDAFGEDTLNVFEKEPMKLTKVRGITREKAENIAGESKKIFALRLVTAFLSEYGIRTQYAMKAFQAFGLETEKIIKENPYVLCDDRIGLNFKEAEKIGMEFGFDLNSPERVYAGVCYILKAYADEGHTCVPLEQACADAMREISVGESKFYDIVNAETENERLCQTVLDNTEYLALPQYFRAETFIADRVNVLLNFQNPKVEDYSAKIAEVEKEKGIEYDEIQKDAIDYALSKNIMILTGGPGTGKTTTLNAIISIYEKLGNKVMLGAPTGRAAKRMADLTGYEAKTIHRLLEVEYDHLGELRFKHDEDNPLPCDVLVVDEMSMVDVLLFESLLRALKLGCKLVLVGDVNQLPSVGAGNLLRDLIDASKVPVVALKKIFRQAQKSCIVTNAHKILDGKEPDLFQKNSDFFYFQRFKPEDVKALIVDLAARRLPKAYGLSPTDDIQIIASSRKGKLGIEELNRILQEKLNPHDNKKNECKTPLYVFREGDKVMQNRNNYDITWKKGLEIGKGIFNGDIGKIILIDKRTGFVRINFDGRIAVYPIQQLHQLELAYAVTVHKSQGSEFEAVIMPVLDEYEKLCDRNILYTAVTRAKKLLILIGTRTEILKMCHNVNKIHRYTLLGKMLKEDA